MIILPNIKKIEGIGPHYSEVLANIGIKTVKALLLKGAEPQARKEIEQKTGIPYTLLYEWIIMADLFRIKGIGEEYPNLLEEAGIRSVTDLAQRDADNLFEKISEIAGKKKIVRKPPNLSMVKNWIEQAKKLPRILVDDSIDYVIEIKTQKRPISITFTVIFGVLFLITSLITILSLATTQPLRGVAIPFLIFGLLSLIVSAVLFNVNSNKHSNRKRGFKRAMSFSGIVASIALVLLIVSSIISPASSPGKILAEETVIAPETTEIKEASQTTVKPVETTIAETTIKAVETTVTQTTIKVVKEFLFDKYIDEVKVREYELASSEDISVTDSFRMKYFITVPKDISEDELKSTFAEFIKNKYNANLDIDMIVVYAWHDIDSISGEIAIGHAEGVPAGNRINYYFYEERILDQTVLIEAEKDSSVTVDTEVTKYGLTETQRKQAFYELVMLQDLIAIDDPKWDEKHDKTYESVAKKYGITAKEAFAIGVEGTLNNWPMPTETSPEETDSVTLGEKQAALKAKEYLDYTSFSYSGLVAQLEYEGFTHKEAVYGVDRCGADWNKQAALKAKEYLDYTSFSRDGLIAQLEYEGFTRQQAEYGVQAVGY